MNIKSITLHKVAARKETPEEKKVRIISPGGRACCARTVSEGGGACAFRRPRVVAACARGVWVPGGGPADTATPTTPVKGGLEQPRHGFVISCEACQGALKVSRRRCVDPCEACDLCSSGPGVDFSTPANPVQGLANVRAWTRRPQRSLRGSLNGLRYDLPNLAKPLRGPKKVRAWICNPCAA